MSQSAQRLPDYLEHIRSAVERISHYTAGIDEHEFLQNQLVQDAVLRNFEIIGEASNRIAQRHQDFAAAHPELPLASAYQMRNAIVHGYFNIDFEIVWKTIHNDLPLFLNQVEVLLAGLPHR